MPPSERDRSRPDVVFVQLPSPPYRDVLRGYAGGFGVAVPSDRATFGHGPVTQPLLPLVYAFSAAVERGVDAGFLDAQAEGLDVERLTERVSRMRPRVIVTCVAMPALSSDLRILRGLKERTGATVVVGGAFCKVRPEEVLREGTADVVITGDVEVVGERLLDRILGSGSAVAHIPGTAVLDERGRVERHPGGELEDLSALPLPALGRLPLGRYRTWEFGREKHFLGRGYGGWSNYFPLYMSHGCPHGCAYCPYPVGFGRRQRVKPVEQVLAEFRAVHDAGIRNVVIRDQVLPVESGELERVCRGLIDGGVRLRWMCEARLGSLPRPLLRLMRSSGCTGIYYGIETGDAETFAHDAKKGIRADRIASALAETEDAGIETSAHFLVGFPDDDWSTIGRTVGLIRRLGISRGDCSVMTPYPGTPHFDRISAEGRLITERWEHFTGFDPIVRLEGLSPLEQSLARWYVLGALAANSAPGLRRRQRFVRDALAGRAAGAAEVSALIEPFSAEARVAGGGA